MVGAAVFAGLAGAVGAVISRLLIRLVQGFAFEGTDGLGAVLHDGVRIRAILHPFAIHDGLAIRFDCELDVDECSSSPCFDGGVFGEAHAAKCTDSAVKSSVMLPAPARNCIAVVAWSSLGIWPTMTSLSSSR